MRKNEPKRPLPRIEATIQVQGKRGIFYVTCERCMGHPIMANSYVPRRPVFARDYVDEPRNPTGFVGGVLPVFTEGTRDQQAACSCEIGDRQAERLNLELYDSLPGTSPEDTKGALVGGNARRLYWEFTGREWQE